VVLAQGADPRQAHDHAAQPRRILTHAVPDSLAASLQLASCLPSHNEARSPVEA
jgi:hypothetical protein